MKDLRIIKTEKSIKEAFISLVEEKGYNKVKIKDICERALINRNTFYLHYYDKEDLIRKMVYDIFVEQSEMMKKIGYSKVNPLNFTEIKSACIQLLNTFYEEIEFYRIILLDSNMRGYINKSSEELKKGLVKLLSLDYKQNHLAIDYIFSGIMGIITEWIIFDNATIQALADTICDIALNDLVKYVILK